MIKIKKLNKYFNYRKKNQIHVLNDITLDLPDKGLVVLLGASGSGKTTLLNVLGGLDKVNSGMIDFKGIEFKKYNARKWDQIRNRKVGYVFQNYNLLPQLSVYDNIAIVLRMLGINDHKIIDQRVSYILNAVNMYPYRKKKALQLSGGQQQRVAIARALVKNPHVIIADEPTGNLDSNNTIYIMNIIKEISKEKLVVLVTHEKNIANFYGDRIIELKDGEITSDVINGETTDYDFTSGDHIYLKDLYNLSSFENEDIKVDLYCDDEKIKPLKIRLIQKNNTLYLDIDSKIKQKLVADNSGVIIKDEHYVKQSRKEITETSFNLDSLNNESVKREKPILLSIKQSLSMAFKKIIRTSRKTKLMLFSFGVAGAIIAMAVAVLANVVILEPEDMMYVSSGNVRVFGNISSGSLSELISYEELLTYGENDDEIYINPYGSTSIYFKETNGDNSKYVINGQIELVDYVDEKRLLMGKMPKERGDVLITTKVADRVLWECNEFGIWNYEQILHEKLNLNLITGRVVGIIDYNIDIIYLDRATITLLESESETIDSIASEFAPKEIYLGRLPRDGEVLIPKEEYIRYFGFEPTETWEEDSKSYPKKISGIYDQQLVCNYQFHTLNDIEKEIYKYSHSIYIHSSNSKELAEKLDNLPNVKAYDVYENALDEAKKERSNVILSTLTSTGILLLFSLIGFYFMIRSSLISRIYEISIFRALGVKKGNIFSSFIVEIVVITTISTMIGYVFTMIILNKIQKGIMFDSIFLVNFLSFSVGLIGAYVINLLAGLLPVYLLLRKTPAQILTQYDI